MAEMPQKVAILGGGVASMAAAYELTRTEELRKRYEVTVYQLGWRLGGKGASGRNKERHQRIEEHGLHIWLGFYDNAFRIMRECYEELGRRPGTPLATWRDAFKECNDVVLYERFQRRWIAHHFQIPGNKLTPGDHHAMPDFWVIVRAALTWLHEQWMRVRPRGGAAVGRAVLPIPLPFGIDEVIGELGHLVKELVTLSPEGWIHAAKLLAELRLDRLVEGEMEVWYRAQLRGLLRRFKAWVWTDCVEPDLANDDLRLFFTMLDVATTVINGIVEDQLIERDFDVIDGEEFRAWLARHGAYPLTIEESPLVRGWYDLAFAYEDGDIARPTMAAGTALHGILRLLFGYRGAFMWKMQAGMGDTVFTPLYRVLKDRGVRFEFFHCVTGLGLSDDRRSVQSIEYVRQVDIVGGRDARYDPLVQVEGLQCWPSQPKWEEIVQGVELESEGVNLEYEHNPLRRETDVLRRGEHFHLVVLGISVAALPPICRELAADEGNSAFRAMLQTSRTVMTQAFQVWVAEPVDKLGWSPPGSVMTGYVEPLDTYADMSQLIDRETWPKGAVKEIGYFCGVLRNVPGEDQRQATDRVHANAVSFLERFIGELWPGAAAAGRGPDWKLLVDDGGARGRRRFDSQFWVANFQPTEHYVLPPPGSVRYRLRADESGYDNLYLTGDWIRTNMDAGCVEAAAMAGMQAARAISGVPRLIAGEDRSWLRRRGRRAT